MKRKAVEVAATVLPCTQEGCLKSFTDAQGLAKHMIRSHSTKERKFPCTITGCGKRFTSKQHLKTHAVVHSKVKSFICDYDGCDQAFTQQSSLNMHQLIHEDCLDFECEICGHKCVQKANFERHMRSHNGHRPFVCTWEGCEDSFVQQHHLDKHMTIHTGEKHFECEWEGCGQMFARELYLKSHMVTHTGERAYHCDVEGCDESFGQSGTLHKHMRTHTVEGMNRRKVQEHRVTQVLSKDFKISTEVTVRYQHGRVLNPDKYCARVDFMVKDILPACVIVECDEHAHVWYELSCELTRQEQIHESLIKSGEERPIVFIRYNPNGAVTTDGVKTDIPRKQREEVLMKVLKDIQIGVVKFTETLNIVYLFYSTRGGIPEICSDPDYTDQSLGCIRSLKQ
jgi:hypothetical protein